MRVRNHNILHNHLPFQFFNLANKFSSLIAIILDDPLMSDTVITLIKEGLAEATTGDEKFKKIILALSCSFHGWPL